MTFIDFPGCMGTLVVVRIKTDLQPMESIILTLWPQSCFLLPSNWDKDNFLHTFTWHEVLFIFTVWHRLFFGTHVSRLRIEALP